jgi:hypothetical protein
MMKLWNDKFIHDFASGGMIWNQKRINGKPHHGAIGTRHS